MPSLIMRQAVFPIEAIKQPLLSSLKEHLLTILVAPPGAGKSTVLPLWLLAENRPGRILLLQPRRVAAKNIAQYLANQLGESAGQQVGYRLRNDTKIGKNTRLEVITEGVLIKMIQQDPELSGVSCIVFDEFHERSAQADLAFALTRDIQLGLRDDLTLLLMSATLSSEELQTQLPDANVLVSEGKMFDVSISYQPVPSQGYWREHASQSIIRACQDHVGCVLVFLPGRADIEFVAEHLSNALPTVLVNTLFGDMTLDAQQQAITAPPEGQTKVVLATNIAETSLTINGVNLVIDSGYEKQAVFDQNTQTNRLSQTRISQASAIQRAGRAGRTMAGQCIRLYSHHDFERMAKQANLPILQTDLIPVALEASRWGVCSLKQLPMLTLPKPHTEQGAWQSLEQLAIVDSNRRLTSHGQACAKLSCHPRFAHMIEQANSAERKGEEGATYLACLVASMLEHKDVFAWQKGHSNVSLLARVSYLIEHGNKRFPFVLKQTNQLFTGYSKQGALKPEQLPLHLLGVLVACAYPERIAKARNQQGSFVSIYNKGYLLAEDDALCDNQYIAVAQLSQVEQRLTVRIAASLNFQDIETWQLAPISTKAVCSYDSSLDKISAHNCQLVGELVVARQSQSQTLTPEIVADLWHRELLKHGFDWLFWSTESRQLKLRWQWLNRYQPHLKLPELSEDYLLANLDTWLLPYAGKCVSKKALNKLNLAELLIQLLNYQQQQILNNTAPTYFVGPTGRKCPITYDLENPPKVSLPMQEIYGLSQSPQIGDHSHGKGVGLVLELMSPANRPIQVTSDLANFWQGSYRAVQKEMKAKYPKHFWPDDPANAQPTNRTKKYM